MNITWKFFILVTILLLLSFILVENLNIQLLTQPSDWIHSRSPQAVTIGIFLLIIDIFLPVPNIFVMVEFGHLFGFLQGALLSLFGMMLANIIGFLLGRGSAKIIQKHLSKEEQEKNNQLIERFGVLALLITRPLPLLAEATIIIAGASKISWKQMLLLCFIGNIPMCFFYAFLGSSATKLENPLLLVIGISLVLGVIVLYFNKWFNTKYLTL